MKTRNGFVSNSSSSSFIIAVPKTETVCKCCNRSNSWLLEAIAKYISTLSETSNELHAMTDAESVESYFKEKLENLVTSKAYAKKQLEEIKEVEKDPKVFEMYERLKTQLQRTSSKTTITQEAQIESFGSSPQIKIKSRREMIEKHLEDYDKNVEELNKLIALIIQHTEENNIFAFTIDNWASKAEEALRSIIRNNEVKVLYVNHT